MYSCEHKGISALNPYISKVFISTCRSKQIHTYIHVFRQTEVKRCLNNTFPRLIPGPIHLQSLSNQHLSISHTVFYST